jgi:hypothetical protein
VLIKLYKKNFSMSDKDIEFLKLKIKLYIVNEEYEKAAELKKWVIEMGGDPKIDNVEILIEERLKKK